MLRKNILKGNPHIDRAIGSSIEGTRMQKSMRITIQSISTYKLSEPRGFSKKNLELHITPSEAVLKNRILAVDDIELPAFREKGWINATTSSNSISGCVSSIISYLNPPFLLPFTFLHS